MEEVQDWLHENNLGEYSQTFDDNGWDDLTLLPDMTDIQIKKCIHKEGHVVKFRKAVKQLKKYSKNIDDEDVLYDWKLVDTQDSIQTTKHEAESRQPVPTSFGDGFPSSKGHSLTDFATVDIDKLQQSERQFDTLRSEQTDDKCRRYWEAGVNNTASSDIFSSAAIENCSTGAFSTSSNEDWSMPITIETNVAENQHLTASTPVNYTYIAHSDHTTVNKTASQITQEFGPSASANENHKDQMETVADGYEKSYNKKLCVETHAFRESKEILDYNLWVTILGKPGDGKSMLAAYLMSLYRKEGFEPVFISSVQDWKNLITCDKVKQFVVIDDMFGVNCLDRLKLNKWVSYLGIMEKIVGERKGNLLVVCTSRKYIFEDAKSSLVKFGLFKRFKLLDLTSDKWKLTTKEKEDIFERYANEYQIGEYSKQDVGRLDPPHGYPHCVVMYCTNIFFRKDGLSFFKNPTECIQKEIDNFRYHDRVKYLVLLLGLLNKTELKVQTIAALCCEPTEVIEKLFIVAGVSLNTSLPDIRNALDSLTNTYLEKDVDGTYHFAHESFMENVAAEFMSVNPFLAIETVAFRLLFINMNNGKSVLSFSTPTPTHIVYVNERILQPIIKRITAELLQRNVFYVIMCDVWNVQKFVNGWVEYVSTLDVNMLEDLFCSDTPACCNLFTTLIQLNKEYVIKTILGNATLCGKLALKNLLQQGLEVACARKCSAELVETIVSHHILSSNRLKGSEMMMNALDNSNLIYAKVLIQYTELDQKYVDSYERGYLHKLLMTRVHREDLHIFGALLKTLLDSGNDIYSEDFLGESPLDVCRKRVDNMVNDNTAVLICSSLVQNEIFSKQISVSLKSNIARKLKDLNDIQTIEKMVVTVPNYFPDLCVAIFCSPSNDIQFTDSSTYFDNAAGRSVSDVTLQEEIRHYVRDLKVIIITILKETHYITDLVKYERCDLKRALDLTLEQRKHDDIDVTFDDILSFSRVICENLNHLITCEQRKHYTKFLDGNAFLIAILEDIMHLFGGVTLLERLMYRGCDTAILKEIIHHVSDAASLKQVLHLSLECVLMYDLEQKFLKYKTTESKNLQKGRELILREAESLVELAKAFAAVRSEDSEYKLIRSMLLIDFS